MDAHRAASGPPGPLPGIRASGPLSGLLVGILAAALTPRSWAGADRRRGRQGRPWMRTAPPRGCRAPCPAPARGSLPGLLGLLVGFLTVGSGTKTIKEWSG